MASYFLHRVCGLHETLIGKIGRLPRLAAYGLAKLVLLFRPSGFASRAPDREPWGAFASTHKVTKNGGKLCKT